MGTDDRIDVKPQRDRFALQRRHIRTAPPGDLVANTVGLNRIGFVFAEALDGFALGVEDFHCPEPSLALALTIRRSPDILNGFVVESYFAQLSFPGSLEE